MKPDMRELLWFWAFILVFAGLLLAAGLQGITDLIIALSAFTASWFTVRFFVKKFGPGGIDRSAMMKELIWFGTILIIFIGLLIAISAVEEGMSVWSFLIAIGAFSFSWIIRSAIIKIIAIRKRK